MPKLLSKLRNLFKSKEEREIDSIIEEIEAKKEKLLERERLFHETYDEYLDEVKNFCDEMISWMEEQDRLASEEEESPE